MRTDRFIPLGESWRLNFFGPRSDLLLEGELSDLRRPGEAESTFGHGCPTCGGSPLCDECGHPRRAHRGVFVGGSGGCMKKMRDVQALQVVDRSCGGYQPRLAGFREAGFASTDEEGAPVLRVLRPSGH